MKRFAFLLLALPILAVASCATERRIGPAAASRQPSAEARAVSFLAKEVPVWFRQNRCFSCHNNGDAVRALCAAAALGRPIPKGALIDTIAWLEQPERWDQNKGDPAFSDKRLATIQFAAALAAAMEAKLTAKQSALSAAAERLMGEQDADGSWRIEPSGALGSPATYGTALATAMARTTLLAIAEPKASDSARQAERWLRQLSAHNLLDAAAVLMSLPDADDAEARGQRRACLSLIRRAQTSDGGWGPFADSPPEPFDTAVVLLALWEVRRDPGVRKLIERGRNFLTSTQLPEGHWPETTRPPRGESYAQRISTTGWATLALLRTGSTR